MSTKTRKIEAKIRDLSIDADCKMFLLRVFDWEVQAPPVRGHYMKPFEEFLNDAMKAKGNQNEN